MPDLPRTCVLSQSLCSLSAASPDPLALGRERGRMRDREVVHYNHMLFCMRRCGAALTNPLRPAPPRSRPRRVEPALATCLLTLYRG